MSAIIEVIWRFCEWQIGFQMVHWTLRNSTSKNADVSRNLKCHLQIYNAHDYLRESNYWKGLEIMEYYFHTHNSQLFGIYRYGSYKWSLYFVIAWWRVETSLVLYFYSSALILLLDIFNRWQKFQVTSLMLSIFFYWIWL